MRATILSPSEISVDSSVVTVHGAATQLVFVTQASGCRVGFACTTQPVVAPGFHYTLLCDQGRGGRGSWRGVRGAAGGAGCSCRCGGDARHVHEPLPGVSPRGAHLFTAAQLVPGRQCRRKRLIVGLGLTQTHLHSKRWLGHAAVTSRVVDQIVQQSWLALNNAEERGAGRHAVRSPKRCRQTKHDRDDDDDEL